MDHVGEFPFFVNETCPSCDHNVFMVAPSDTDARSPILLHVTPSDIEKHVYLPPEKKIQRKERLRSRTSARVFVMEAPNWIRHGSTGMVDLGGLKVLALVMVAPLLPRRVNGDQRNECPLLSREDNTRCFCSVQLF